MLITQLDEPAIERIISFLCCSSEGLKGLHSFHLAYPSLAHLTGRQFLKVHSFPPEGLKYRFKSYKRDSNGERVKIYTCDSQIDMLLECKNLKELSLMHPLKDLDYSHGYDIGRNCVKLEKVVGLHNSIEFISGLVDGLQCRIALDDIQIQQITVKSIQTREEDELRYHIAKSLPRLKKFTVLRFMVKGHKVMACPPSRFEIISRE